MLMGHLELHKMPILYRYTFCYVYCYLNIPEILDQFCTVSNDYGAYRWFSLRKFINSNKFLITHTKPQLSIKLLASVCHFMLQGHKIFTYVFIFSRINLILIRHLLLPSQLGYFNADCGSSCIFDM